MRTIFELTIEERLKELPEGVLTENEIMDIGIDSLKMLDGEEVFTIDPLVIRNIKEKGEAVYSKYAEAIMDLIANMDIVLTFNKK